VLDRHYYLSRLVTVSTAVLSAVEEGIKDALESPETVVTHYDIHRFLAAVYMQMGKPHEARACLEAAAEVAPLPHVIDIQIGQLLAAEGDDAGALEVFRRAAGREPGFYRAWLNMGLTLSRMERHNEAVEAALRARALNPTGYTSLKSLAGVMERAGRLDEAAEVLENLIRIHGDKQWPYLQLISLYESQNKLSHAVRIARLLASLHPEEPVFQEQLRQLEQAQAIEP
jgi:tetratricopeptide (TPR) repeat protein